MTGPVHIEPVHASHCGQVSLLLVHAFKGKFLRLTGLDEKELAICFERLLEDMPEETAGKRVVATQYGEVIGTMALKRRRRPEQQGNKVIFPRTSGLTGWPLLKLGAGLLLLDHSPGPGECYVADLSVDPKHRGEGVGKALLDWAKSYTHSDPELRYTSLHAAESNSGARRLYEREQFRRERREYSLLRKLLVGEGTWDYMIAESGT